MIGMNRQQRLHFILNLVSSIGIASLINSLLLVNKHTRFIYYYYFDKNQYIHNDKSKVKSSIPERLLDTTITHIVTQIKFRIHVVIVLEVPSDDQIDLDDYL